MTIEYSTNVFSPVSGILLDNTSLLPYIYSFPLLGAKRDATGK